METIGMLDHQKIVLEKVTSDNKTFVKELRKSLKWLNAGERKELYAWLRENFWESHRYEIERVFKVEYAA
ncbi:MAG: hypothetical protein JW801_06670 [Bacteroidales bacterium]|nr:hypothetical protein [Bacteroidales bacterium]